MVADEGGGGGEREVIIKLSITTETLFQMPQLFWQLFNVLNRFTSHVDVQSEVGSALVFSG